MTAIETREDAAGPVAGPLLECKGIDVAYGPVQVLFGVDLTVERGEIVVSTLAAEARGLTAGDTLALPTPRGRKRFRVAGTYEDLTSFDSIYIGYDTYTRYWNDHSALTGSNTGVAPRRATSSGTERKVTDVTSSADSGHVPVVAVGQL